MSDDLRDEHYRTIGLTREAMHELVAWVLERVGYVFDKDACGGSGVFVETHEGEIALLTASHVVIPAILSTQFSVGAYDRGQSQFRPPSCIILSSRCDAALIVPHELRVPVHLSRDAWQPENTIDVNPGDKMIAAGLPGEWKGVKDLERRVVQGARVMLLWTEATHVRKDEIEMVARWNLPSTLAGMSGGPLFSIDRQLIGIHMAERRVRGGRAPFSLISTRRHAWADLFDPSDIPWPKDLVVERFRWEHTARYDGKPVRVSVEGWFGASPSEPSHARGSFGLIQKMLLLNSEETSRYTINIFSTFIFNHDDDSDAKKGAFIAHARELLTHLGFTLDD